MKKILISIYNDTLTFSYKAPREEIDNNLLNTHTINNNEVIFSNDYINNNIKLVTSFIKEICKDRNINKLVINSNEMAPYILEITSKIDLEYICFKENKPLTFKIAEKLTTYNNVKTINCYSIPTFLLELLDRNGILVESRCEILFTSRFMTDNNLTSYSKMFYKINLRISVPLTTNDLDDFEAFCKINKYLKNIHLDMCDTDTIDNIVAVLHKNRIKNIKIYIHNNIHDEKIVEALRKLNKKYINKYKITLKLSYDKKYISDNFVKQIIFTTIKVCAILMFIIIGGVFGYVLFNNKTSEDNVNKITDEINTLLKKVEDEDSEKYSNGNYLKSLLTVNSDTVGWLTVLGTKIDYPVVQTNDNSYYLNKNFNKEKDYNGWVFMDYRNNIEELDKNTIIYAHNRFYSGVMFGTLSNVTKKNWLNNEDNYTITFNTLEENLSWKVFSIYSVKVTSDYLYKDFATDNDWLDFVDMLKDRSDYEFDTTIGVDDKILTLSTCLENDKRLVVHAVLEK